MSGVPSMWRPELWHPLCIHFPIATLLLATLAALIRPLLKAPASRLFLSQLTPVLLTIGVVTGWLAIYTGELSYNVVVRTICDPPVLQQHQWWSYASVIAYTLALAGNLAAARLQASARRITGIAAMTLLIAGAGGLMYAGHLGASLVYQQSGGTYKPSADCTEFGR